MIKVYAVNIRNIKGIEDIATTHITNERLKRIDRLFFLEDKKRCLVAELIIHFYMRNVKNNANYNISIDDNGKPQLVYFSDVFFNISHSGDWVVCAFSNYEIGIDIEKIKDAKMNVARKYYSDDEYKKMICIHNNTEQNEFFYLLWTLKESYLKNIGMGITALSPKISFDTSKNIKGYIDCEKIEKKFFSQKFDDNYYLSICYDLNEKIIENKYFCILDFEQLFV